MTVGANSTQAPAEASTVISDGYTFVSPSEYVIYTSIAANLNYAGGAFTGFAGSQYTSLTKAYPPGALSTVHCDANPRAIDFQDLNSPPRWSVVALDYCDPGYAGLDSTTTSRNPTGLAYGYTLSPEFVIPPDITTVDPAWKGCSIDPYGALDPPFALIKQADAGAITAPGGLPNPTPSSQPLPAVAVSTPGLASSMFNPEPISSADPGVHGSSVATQPAPLGPASTPPVQHPASVDPGINNGGHASNDPGISTAPAPAATSPLQQDPKSGGDPSNNTPSDSPPSQPQQPKDHTSNGNGGDPFKNSPPQPDQPNNPAHNGIGIQSTPADPGTNGNGAQSAQADPGTSIVTVLTIAGQTFHALPNGRISVAGTTINAGDPGVSVGNGRVSLEPGGLVLGGSTVQVISNTAGAVPAAAPSFAGQPVQPAPNGGVVIGGTTLSAGGVATVQGTPISINNGGIIVPDSTIPLALPGSPYPTPPQSTDMVFTLPGAQPIATIAGQTISSNLDDPNGGILIDGSTLAPGATTTIGGTLVIAPSAGSNGNNNILVIGTSPIALPTAAPKLSPAALNSLIQSILPNDSAVILANGQTLSAGGSAATVSGSTISVLPSGEGLVINKQTIALPASTSSGGGIGGFIVSAFNHSGPASPPTALGNETGSGNGNSSIAGNGIPFLGSGSTFKMSSGSTIGYWILQGLALSIAMLLNGGGLEPSMLY